jgi:LmbE family N-acetylglucosaminyl deacetylase
VGAVLNFAIHKDDGAPLSLLCLGAHCDDIEIGCGGSLLTLLERHAPVEVTWAVLSAHGERETEARQSAQRFLEKASKRQIIFKQFRDGFFPYQGGELKEFFEELKSWLSPDLIFTHYRHDLHQDHRLTSELTWNTFRNHFILEYEVFKYDGDLGSSNGYVHLTERTARKKLDYIRECYPSQRGRTWFDEKIFRSLMILRGVESNAPEKLAEAFYCRKIIFKFV